MISQAIRGEIGFDGVLVSDDLSMRALGGEVASARRVRWPPAAISSSIAMATAARWKRSLRRRGRSPRVPQRAWRAPRRFAAPPGRSISTGDEAEERFEALLAGAATVGARATR